MIDIMKRTDGKIVTGHRIRFLNQKKIDQLYHSYNGYSIEIFDTEAEAVAYWGELLNIIKS